MSAQGGRAEGVARRRIEGWNYDGVLAEGFSKAKLAAELAADLRAYAEEARREERDVAAKDAEMRYEDGYACGVKDEREACGEFAAGEAITAEALGWQATSTRLVVAQRIAAAIRARETTVTASPGLPSTDTRVKGLVPRATTVDNFKAGDIARGEGT